MHSLGIYPAKEDGEIVLYDKKTYVDKYCQPQGCYLEDEKYEEIITRAKKSKDFLGLLADKLYKDGYAPFETLQNYFPDLTEKDLGGIYPSPSQDSKLKTEIDQSTLSHLIRQQETDLDPNSKSLFDFWVDNLDPIFGTRAMSNFVHYGYQRLSFEENLNALIGFSIIYGLTERVAVKGIKVTADTVVKIPQMVEDISSLKSTLKGGKAVEMGALETKAEGWLGKTAVEVGTSTGEHALAENKLVKILGEVDPKTLTKEEFEKSPNLLYHGSHKPLEFSRDFDYKTEYEDAGGGRTIGKGFYTTDNRSAAEKYSFVRQVNREQIYVSDILPYKAKMLDLRSPDLKNNIPVPQDLVDKWTEYFFQNQQQLKDNLPGAVLKEAVKDYGTYLKRVNYLLKNNELSSVDLRTMLGSSPDVQRVIKWDRDFPYSGPWTDTWTDFIKSEGYDGLIYIEGGEGTGKVESASFVFYNYDRIGTYETWHR